MGGNSEAANIDHVSPPNTKTNARRWDLSHPARSAFREETLTQKARLPNVAAVWVTTKKTTSGAKEL